MSSMSISPRRPVVNGSSPSWWKRLLSKRAAPASSSPGPASTLAPLATRLPPDGAVIWTEPLSRSEVLHALVDRAVASVPGLAADEALRRLQERDALGSTAIGDGVDLPHARIEGLTAPALAIGLPQAGLSDAELDSVEVVWLLLLPPGAAGLGATAQVARACRDGAFRSALREAADPADVRGALARWERAHEPPTALWAT